MFQIPSQAFAKCTCYLFKLPHLLMSPNYLLFAIKTSILNYNIEAKINVVEELKLQSFMVVEAEDKGYVLIMA